MHLSGALVRITVLVFETFSKLPDFCSLNQISRDFILAAINWIFVTKLQTLGIV